MRAKDLERDLALYFQSPEGEIDARVRQVRDTGDLPIGPQEAAMMLLALVSRHASDAGSVAQIAAGLKPVNIQSLNGAMNVRQALERLLGSKNSHGVRQVMIDETGTAAWFLLTNGPDNREIVWVTDEIHAQIRPTSRVRTFGEDSIGRRLVIGIGVLETIGAALRDVVNAASS